MINALQIGNKYCYKDVVMVHGHFIDEGEDLVFSTNASRDGGIPVILGVVSKQRLAVKIIKITLLSKQSCILSKNLSNFQALSEC